MQLDDFLCSNVDVSYLILSHLKLHEQAKVKQTNKKLNYVCNTYSTYFPRVQFGDMKMCVKTLTWEGPLSFSTSNTTVFKSNIKDAMQNELLSVTYDSGFYVYWRSGLYAQLWVDLAEIYGAGRYRRAGSGPHAMVPWKSRIHILRKLSSTASIFEDIQYNPRQAKLEYSLNACPFVYPAPCLPAPWEQFYAYHNQGDDWLHCNFPSSHTLYTHSLWIPEINVLVLGNNNSWKTHFWFFCLNTTHDQILRRAALPPIFGGKINFFIGDASTRFNLPTDGATLEYNAGFMYIIGGKGSGNRKLQSIIRFPIKTYVEKICAIEKFEYHANIALRQTLAVESSQFSLQDIHIRHSRAAYHIIGIINNGLYLHDTTQQYEVVGKMQIPRIHPLIRFIDNERIMMVAAGITAHNKRPSQAEFIDLETKQVIKLRCLVPDNATE